MLGIHCLSPFNVAIGFILLSRLAFGVSSLSSLLPRRPSESFRPLTGVHHFHTKEKNRERFRKDERSYLSETSAWLRCNQSSFAKRPPLPYYGAAGTKKR
jgi:hypothetical protein